MQIVNGRITVKEETMVIVQYNGTIMRSVVGTTIAATVINLIKMGR